MRTVKKCDDVPPKELIEVIFLEVSNDVVLVFLNSRYKAFINKDKNFTLQELDWLDSYLRQKIKSFDLKPSDQLVVIDIVDDLRMLIKNRL